MNTLIAAQPISSSIFYHSYNPEADANCAAWLPCENTLCQELPNKKPNEIKKICRSKNFTDIHSHFLQNIKKLKDLTNVYISDEKTKSIYEFKIDIFYNNIKDHHSINNANLTSLFNYTCRQICRIVSTLEQHQSESTESKNTEKTRHNSPLKKEEIVFMLTDLVHDIDTCLPGVQTRFKHTYEQLEAIKSQDSLPAQIANIKTQLLHSHTLAFMQQQQRMQKLAFDDSMEIHYFNYFNNLVCQQLGFKPVNDYYKPSPSTIGNGVEDEFVLQTSLKVNSFTIINKFVEQWSEQLSNILEQNGLSAWLEKAIPAKKLTAEYTDVISSQFIKPINCLFANETSEPLTLHDLFEVDESYTTYSLRDFKAKLQAFAAQIFFGKDTTQIISKLPGKQGESLCIGTTDKNFFWVFENNSSSNAAKALNRDNYTALQLSHLKTTNFNKLNKHTRSALLIQALEQTDNIDDVTSFFLDKKILKTLQNLPPTARRTIFAKLDNKISACTQDQKDTAIKSIIDHFTTLASTNKQPLQQKDLECWTNTSLLEPLLCRLKENKVKIRAITAALNSSQVDTFSQQSIIMLFSAQQCQTFFKQALKLKHTDFISRLLLTKHCDEQISSKKQQKALLKLFATTGSISGLEYLLSKINTTIDYQDSDTTTPLHLAVGYGHTHCAKLLLEKNFIDVNCQDLLDDTVLHIALKQGFTELAELLLNRSDIAVNQKNSLGHTALHLAVTQGQTECVELLLTKDDIGINQTDQDNYTPLHYAARYGQTHCVKLLLEKHGIDINQCDSKGNTPLHLTLNNGFDELAELLINRSDIEVNKKNNLGYTALHQAVTQGQTEYVELLLAKDDIDINQTDKDNYTPLHYAAQYGQTHCVKLLLKKHGIDVNSCDSQGNTALHLAAMNGQLKCAELLLAKGCDINAKNDYGDTPLHRAAMNNNTACVELLLNKGSDINKINDQGDTPLHRAASNNKLECVKFLLSKGSISTTFNQDGYTPLHFAAQKGHSGVIKLIIQTIPDITVNQPDFQGNTALHLAAEHARPDCVKWLLTEANRATINSTNKQHRTALHAAATGQTEGHTQCVKLLVAQESIDINSQDKKGLRAVDIAKSSKNKKSFKLLKAHSQQPQGLSNRLRNAWGRFTGKYKGTDTSHQTEMASTGYNRKIELPETSTSYSLNPASQKPNIDNTFKEATYTVIDSVFSLDEESSDLAKAKINAPPASNNMIQTRL